MSGGSYDYVSHRFEVAAGTLRDRHPHEPHVLALAAHLDAIAAVMAGIEWTDSDDTSWTPELDGQIRALLAPDAELRVATETAQRAAAQLNDVLQRSATTSALSPAIKRPFALWDTFGVQPEPTHEPPAGET